LSPGLAPGALVTILEVLPLGSEHPTTVMVWAAQLTLAQKDRAIDHLVSTYGAKYIEISLRDLPWEEAEKIPSVESGLALCELLQASKEKT
jgi:hypothetical protein